MDYSFPGSAPPVEEHDDSHRAPSPQQLATPANPFLTYNKPLASRENVIEATEQPIKPVLFSDGPPKLSTTSSHYIAPSPTSADHGRRSEDDMNGSIYSIPWGSSSRTTIDTTVPPPIVHTIPASSAVSSDAWVDVSCTDARYKLDQIMKVMDGTILETEVSASNDSLVSIRFQSVLQAHQAAGRTVATLEDGSTIRIQHAAARSSLAATRIPPPPPVPVPTQLLITNVAAPSALSMVRSPPPNLYRSGLRPKRLRAADRSFCERIWMLILAVDDLDVEEDVHLTIRSSKKSN